MPKIRIKKKETITPLMGKVLNEQSNSQEDAYSCDYINDKIEVQNVTTAGTNLNDYKETGTYFFQDSSVTPTNIPAGSNGWLSVLKGDDMHCKQIWYRLGSGGNHFQTYIRTYLAGTWSEWQRLMVSNDIYYKDGDTFTNLSYIACTGHLTASSKSVYFTLPVEKKLDNIKSITINSISASVRHADGAYIAQGDLKTLGTIAASKSTNNLLRFKFDLTTAATTAANNAPLAVDIIDIKLTFNK